MNQKKSPRNCKREYLARGHIFCGTCGKKLAGETRIRGSKEYSYYRCVDWYKTCRTCKSLSYRGDKLDDRIWQEVENVLEHPDLVTEGIKALQVESGKAKAYEDELESITTRITHYEVEKQRVYTAYRVGGDLDQFKADLKFVTNELEALNERQAEIESRIEAIRKAEVDTEGIKQACEAVRKNATDLDFAGKRLALEALGIKVWVTKEQIKIEGALPIVLSSISL